MKILTCYSTFTLQKSTLLYSKSNTSHVLFNCSIVQGNDGMDGDQGPPGEEGPKVSHNLEMVGSCI